MKDYILPVESIQERDVDIILLEELSVDLSFCEWFVNELNLPKITSVNHAWKSISDFGLGETDILFSYNSDQGKIFLLIENKLDASFQEYQFERYEKRAIEYKNKGECNEAFSILFAPKIYCENQNDFENYITYESVSKRLESTGSKRNIFKSELLKIASEKLRRGYKPVNSEPVQKFWHSYWDYKEKHYPELRMKKPGIVPHGSDWPMLFDDNLKGIAFHHKFAQGNVDATFFKFPDKFELNLKGKLQTEMKIVKHNKSFSVRIFSGKIDRTGSFDEQIENVDRGLKNILRLRDWLIEIEILTGYNIGKMTELSDLT